jgi:pimeloyl-ACP methyl ester carboxylesterase
MINYITIGKGVKQLIFIHGNSQSCEGWGLVMNNNLLSDNYKLIAIDLPGHGKSTRSDEPKKDYSLFGMAKLVKDFISGFDKDEYILVGNSLGANIIGEIANELSNCKGIMITGSSAIGKNLTAADIIKPNPNIVACFMADPTDQQIEQVINEVGVNLTVFQKEDIRRNFKNTDPAFRTSMAEAIGTGSYADELSNMEKSGVQISVVFGEEDKLCFTDYLDKVPFKKWKNKTLLIPNSGHFSQLDQPELLVSIIKEFSDDCFN